VVGKWVRFQNFKDGFPVKDAYKILTSVEHSNVDLCLHIIWNKALPLEVSLYAWKLLKKEIPTKDNLVCRGIVASDTLLCSGGCGLEEKIDQLFLHCNLLW